MILKVCLVLGAICAVAVAFEPEPNPYDNPVYFGDQFLQRWDNFRGKFNKTYATQTEEAVRMMIFRMNCMFIDDHNAKGDSGFEMGETYFTDMTPREFGKVLGTKPPPDDEEDSGEVEGGHGGHGGGHGGIDDGFEENQIEGRNSGGGDSGADIDHSKDSCIGPVEHQMTCGSCWAFSTSHVAAWHYCKKNGGKYTNLSEQQLVDCDKSNNGCTSGYTKKAGKYIVKNGILADEDYPYISKQDKCHKDLLKDAGKLHHPISGTKTLPKNEKSLKPGLEKHGPLMVIIDASTIAFYTKGVISDTFCDHGEVNHAVVLVGAVDKTWKVKNSWGPEWGENGYFNLEMNSKAKKGCLGIGGYPSYALP